MRYHNKTITNLSCKPSSIFSLHILKRKHHFFFVFFSCVFCLSSFRNWDLQNKIEIVALTPVNEFTYCWILCMWMNKAQKLLFLLFPAMSLLSITASYLTSLTLLDHCTLSKTVTAEYFVLNKISFQQHIQVTLEAGSNRKKNLLRARSLNTVWDTVRK